MIPQDYKERLAAALPSGKNIIVEAGAGTGKTTLLADRLCYLILGKGIKIDEIVALTFTDKAAAEIKLRLLETMRSILADLKLPEPKLEVTKNLTDGEYFKKTKEELAETIETSFELIERAQICTIHSFALQILRLYPLAAGLAPDIEIDTGFIANYIFNKNWSVFLEEELSLSSPHRALWGKLLEKFSLETLKEFALLLLEPYFDYCKFDSSSEEIQTFFARKVSLMKSLLLSNTPEGKKRKIENQIEEAINRIENLSKNMATLSKAELLKLPVQEEIVFVKSSKPPKGWENEEDIEAVKNFITLANTLTPTNLDLLEQTYNLFSAFTQKVKREMIKQNVVSYNQSILFARDLVEKDLSVRAELKKRYKSIMIDEFQDTDLAQGQLLLFLSEAQNSVAKKWQDIVLEQGKLFVVGDPKQSIYRFRGANISAYEKFLELMQKQQARTCFLTTNFRSQKNIISFVNKWGKNAIKEKPLIQPPYIALETGKEELGEKVEFLQITGKEKQKQDDLRANEANIVAAWIKENVGIKKIKQDKTLSYKDITILYSAGTGIKFYTDALERFNIPYNLEASGNFYEAQEIIDILNILKVIYDPQDKLALLGVLRSPLCAMKDEEIISLWQQKALNIFAQDFQGSKEVKEIYKLLRNFHQRAGHITLKQLLEEILYKTDFLILETLAAGGEQALANLNKFAKIVLNNAEQGFTLGQMLLYIQTYGKADKDEGQSSLIEENFDVVNIMSIHKAKGLQAPYVIVIDTGHKETTEKELYYKDTLGGTIGVGLGPLKNLNYFILQEQEILHKKAQAERLLYVALTRAEKKLLICVSQQETSGSMEKSLRQAGCYPTEENPETEIFTTTDFAYQDPQSFILRKNKEISLKKDLDLSGALSVWQKRKEEFVSYQQEETLTPSNLPLDKALVQRALNIGSLVHKTLNLYFQTGSFDLALAMKVLNLHDTALLEPCQEIIDTFAKGSILKKLKTMRFLDSEIPFSMYENGVLVNGVIDILFEDSKGQLFIVDFKTDKIDSIELENYSLKYGRQLTLYRRAVEKMFKTNKVKTLLAYLRLDKTFEL
jgi:ATP-dependent exoDNAse (exonuclease V) beta subunit (contains helicase and exonuclease domains)